MCLCWLHSDTMVSLMKTGDFLYLVPKTPGLPCCSNEGLSLALKSLSSQSLMFWLMLCPLAWLLSVVVAVGCEPVFWGWDMVYCILAILLGAARLGAVCERTASIRSGWHSAYRLPSP